MNQSPENVIDEIAAPLPVTHHETQFDLEDEDKHLTSRPQNPPSRKASHIRQLYIISHLIFFSFLGTLARVGLQWLTSYPNAPITTPVLWANVGGSFIMGLLSENKASFQSRKHKDVIPLYIGLTVGFCGSFTSFSSFMRDAFLAMSNDLPSSLGHPALPSQSRSKGYSVLAVLAVLLVTPAMSLAALIFGVHFGSLTANNPPKRNLTTLTRFVDPLMVFLAIICWLIVIFIGIFATETPWRGEVVFALIFAPLGTLLRFYISSRLNSCISTFPLGTFTANILGIAVLAMCYDLQHAYSHVGILGCQFLQGVMDGFCGCLTTVSTWVLEIKGLHRRHAYIYGCSSVFMGLAVITLLLGTVRWSVAWHSAICAVG